MNSYSDKVCNCTCEHDAIQGVCETTKDVKSWAFTIKKLGRPSDTCLLDYANVLEQWTKNPQVKVKEAVLERDSKGKLHVHGIATIKKNFYRHKLGVHGFNMKLDEIYDEQGWERYLHKQFKQKVDNSQYLF